MKKIGELNKLPEHLKREVLDFAEYLLAKYKFERKETKVIWTDVSKRGPSKGELASETISRMRAEERW